ncbi:MULTISPECIES: DotH/IcmK family type IV secretion protein [Cysteiniphilum]|uniref:DotH/IcmK family type IV secretion protein n=1 Tax=Cysteiniphilum TaxID=2056696 RepID=UPI0017832C84|nr:MULTISPECIES: DotH/IcmK family type IV secretion protein [Cysteiniphilum]
MKRTVKLTISYAKKSKLIAVSCLCFFLLPVTVLAKKANTVDNQAFDNVVKQSFPMTPEQISAVRSSVAQQKQAASALPGSSDKPGKSRTLLVDLSPSSKFSPPVIRLNLGMITSVIFTDDKGNIWPITSYTIGNTENFDVVWQKASGVLMLQGKKAYAQTNMAVMLKNLQTPVMLTILSSQHSWDYMDYVRIKGVALYGKSLDTASVSDAPDYLTGLLYGTPPPSAKSLNVLGGADAKLWQYNGHYLLLTSATLISPAWIAKAQNNGVKTMNAYELAMTPNIVLSDNDKVKQLTIEIN